MPSTCSSQLPTHIDTQAQTLQALTISIHQANEGWQLLRLRVVPHGGQDLRGLPGEWGRDAPSKYKRTPRKRRFRTPSPMGPRADDQRRLSMTMMHVHK